MTKQMRSQIGTTAEAPQFALGLAKARSDIVGEWPAVFLQLASGRFAVQKSVWKHTRIAARGLMLVSRTSSHNLARRARRDCRHVPRSLLKPPTSAARVRSSETAHIWRCQFEASARRANAGVKPACPCLGWRRCSVRYNRD